MIVFKTYFKIVKKSLPMILTYAIIFLFFAVMVPSSNSDEINFTASKPKIVVINNDGDTMLLRSLNKYLEENSEIVNIEDSGDSLRDALFFRQVDYIIKIPKNFTADFMAGKEPKIDVMKIPGVTGSMYAEMIINKYLQTAGIYAKLGADEEMLSEKILENFKDETRVILSSNEASIEIEKANYYYNFINYVFLAQAILIIGMLMYAFNKVDVKRRNNSSPISIKRFNMELTLANIVMAVGMWAIYVLLSFVLYKNVMLSTNGLWLAINSFVFMISVLTLGFLVANLVKSRAVNSGVTNVISLGTSFICGAFVPQMYLGSTVLTLAKIFPSYWFVKNNDIICGMTAFNVESLTPVLINIGVMILFSIGFLIATNMVSIYKRKR